MMPLAPRARSRSKFEPPRRAVGQAPAEDVMPVRPDDEEVAVGQEVLVFLEPSFSAPTPPREGVGRLNADRGTSLRLRRLELARREGESEGDAAADDQRHRDPEEHENAHEEAVHSTQAPR